jgi:hypothetical protein
MLYGGQTPSAPELCEAFNGDIRLQPGWMTRKTMKDPRVNECVKLKQDIPELGLHRGEVGFVRSVWLKPSDAYEVEFQRKSQGFRTLAVLMHSQIARELKVYGPLLRGEIR